MGTTIAYWFELGHSSFTLKEKNFVRKTLNLFQTSCILCILSKGQHRMFFFGCKVSCRHGVTSMRVGGRIPAKMSVVSVELF